MSVGSGAVAGLEPDIPPVGGPVVRRKKFAGKDVFVVDPNTFYKARYGKRKHEHYERYLDECDCKEEIRAFGRKYWDKPIILQCEKTGAMIYLKYGKK